jgi:Kef-type K+ transport system membrane component KefB
MGSVIFVLAVVLVAYTVAARTFRVRMMPFFLSSLFVYGIEFILLGVVAGPKVLNILDARALDSLWSPFPLVLAWIGMLTGLQFRVKDLRNIATVNYRIAAWQSVIVFCATLIVLLPICFVMGSVFLTFRQSLPVIFALASISAVSAPIIISSVSRRYKAHGRFTRILRYVSASDACVGIVLFGFTLSFFRAEYASDGAFLPGLAWFVATVGIGVLLGFLYHVFMELELDRNERLAMAVAMIVLAAGVATVLDISALFLSFVIGVVLTNFTDKQDKLFRLLAMGEKPLFGFLLIVAGAKWNLYDPACVALGLWIVVLRAAAKVIGIGRAFDICDAGKFRSNMFGLALTGQGGIAFAMALDFLGRYPGSGADLLLGAVIVSFLVNGLLSPYMVRGFLRSEGEIE